MSISKDQIKPFLVICFMNILVGVTMVFQYRNTYNRWHTESVFYFCSYSFKAQSTKKHQYFVNLTTTLQQKGIIEGVLYLVPHENWYDCKVWPAAQRDSTKINITHNQMFETKITTIMPIIPVCFAGCELDNKHLFLRGILIFAN